MKIKFDRIKISEEAKKPRWKLGVMKHRDPVADSWKLKARGVFVPTITRFPLNDTDCGTEGRVLATGGYILCTAADNTVRITTKLMLRTHDNEVTEVFVLTTSRFPSNETDCAAGGSVDAT